MDNALKYFSDSIQANYEFPRSINNLANTLRKKNELGRAISCYEQAIKVHNFLIQTKKETKKFHIAHFNLCTAYFEMNNIPSCIENLCYALEDHHSTILKPLTNKGFDFFLDDGKLIL